MQSDVDIEYRLIFAINLCTSYYTSVTIDDSSSICHRSLARACPAFYYSILRSIVVPNEKFKLFFHDESRSSRAESSPAVFISPHRRARSYCIAPCCRGSFPGYILFSFVNLTNAYLHYLAAVLRIRAGADLILFYYGSI